MPHIATCSRSCHTGPRYWQIPFRQNAAVKLTDDHACCLFGRDAVSSSPKTEGKEHCHLEFKILGLARVSSSLHSDSTADQIQDPIKLGALELYEGLVKLNSSREFCSRDFCPKVRTRELLFTLFRVGRKSSVAKFEELPSKFLELQSSPKWST